MALATIPLSECGAFMKAITFSQIRRKDRAVDDEAWIRSTLHRVTISEWSGKRKQAAADFPNAFWFAETTYKKE